MHVHGTGARAVQTYRFRFDSDTNGSGDCVRLNGPRMLVLVLAPPVLALILAACGDLMDSFSGEPADDFEMMPYNDHAILGEHEVMFSDVLANTDVPVVLNFWAADCPPCRAEMPAFQRVADELEGEVVFLGLDVGVFTGLGSHEGGRRLLAELDITYPAGYATNAGPVRDYEVSFMPTTVFISSEGTIQERVDGQISERMLREILEDVL
jgi:thiol-disulfide isomerase/thioredoxin